MQKNSAGQFKSRCLAVMDEVAESGRPVVITKHGKPVVQIIPLNWRGFEHQLSKCWGRSRKLPGVYAMSSQN